MTDSTQTQVLTFSLGSESYCVDIAYVAEIVDDDTVHPVPNTADHVMGVTDLRGETTTILDPASLLAVDTETLVTDGGERTDRIVVLDGDAVGSGSTGWLVSEIHDVSIVDEASVDTETTADSEFLQGILKTDDGFTLWLDAHALAA